MFFGMIAAPAGQEERNKVAQICEGAFIDALARAIDRNFPRNRKRAAAEMGIDEPRLTKWLSGRTLEDIDARRGEHSSLQRIERLARSSPEGLRAVQDWVMEIGAMIALEVLPPEERVQFEIQTELGVMQENFLKMTNLLQLQHKLIGRKK